MKPKLTDRECNVILGISVIAGFLIGYALCNVILEHVRTQVTFISVRDIAGFRFFYPCLVSFFFTWGVVSILDKYYD